MELEFDFSEINRMAARHKGAEAIVQEEIRAGVMRSVIQIEADAKRRVPVDTHTLQRSLTHEVTTKGRDVTGRAGTNLSYAETVETGRDPGKMPPAGVLVGWMGRHGIPLAPDGVAPKKNKAGYYQVEFLVARAINSRKKANPYLKPAFDKNRAAITRERGTAVPRRILTRLGSRS